MAIEGGRSVIGTSRQRVVWFTLRMEGSRRDQRRCWTVAGGWWRSHRAARSHRVFWRSPGRSLDRGRSGLLVGCLHRGFPHDGYPLVVSSVLSLRSRSFLDLSFSLVSAVQESPRPLFSQSSTTGHVFLRSRGAWFSIKRSDDGHGRRIRRHPGGRSHRGRARSRRSFPAGLGCRDPGSR